MKIVFDNEKQKETFIRDMQCPTLIDSNAIEHRECEDAYCITCWKNCGIELEVKDENSI